MAAALLPAAVCDGAEAADEDATAEELLQDAQNMFGDIFSVQAPRDAFAGICSGMKCMLSGVMLGLAGVVVQPYEGLRDGGVMGCFRGVVLGLFTGLLFSITGLGTGIFQAVRGVVATPRAVCMAHKGQRWDNELGNWGEPKVYSLPEEAAQVLAEGDDYEAEEAAGLGASGSGGPSSSSRGPRPARHVVDTYYYDRLGVTASASEREIRRAYFSLSRQWHPDKTSDPNAKECFQAISEAYQVLSDKERRRAYDMQGRPGAGESFVDAQIFFNVLFGADLLVPFVGQLRLGEVFDANILSGLGEEGSDATAGIFDDDGEKAIRQVQRQVQLAMGLVERLDPYVSGASSSFSSDSRAEVRGILQRDATLDRFFNEIGWVYRNRAELHLASLRSRLGALGFHAICVRLQRGGRELRQKATTAKLAVRSFMVLRKIVQEADSKGAEDKDAQKEVQADHWSCPSCDEINKKTRTHCLNCKAPWTEASASSGRSTSAGGGADASDGEQDVGEDEEELSESLTNALPTFMETFWSLTAHDITGTLDRVVERVLGDESVSIGDRRCRAEALIELGTIIAEEVAESRRAPSQAAGEGEGGEDDRKRRRFEEAFIASLGGGQRQ